MLYTKSSFPLSPPPSLALPNLHNNNFSIRKAKHTLASKTTTTMMSTSFNPDQARVPPILPLPTPPLTKFKIALCQLLVTTDKERNIVHARKAIEKAANNGAQLIPLPFKIALCQLLVTTDKERNIVHARKAIEKAANNGAQLIPLP
ncbi:unnamed protein product [Camellia sinensis]